MESKMMMLYPFSAPTSVAGENGVRLYRQGNYKLENGIPKIEPGNVLDLGTYFNCFSIRKWMLYTHLNRLKIQLDFKGDFELEFYGMVKPDENEKETEEERKIPYELKNQNFGDTIFKTDVSGNFVREFNFDELNDYAKKFDLLGIKLTSKTPGAEFLGGTYFGEFSETRPVKIGITICTFKREQYLLPNLEKLKHLTDRNPDFSVMVIDNGRTLEEKKSDALQIIHNRNYGGAGGFTRGLMEQVSQDKNTHILLMDDDIVIEISSLDRVYSFLRGLKPEYNEEFFAGAMLNLDVPTVQVANTEYWRIYDLRTFGKLFELSDKRTLCENDHAPHKTNGYSAWWFCCIPTAVVKKIGYPLPIFIKCDDIEYSLRNGKNFITINGVGVWHEAFEKKANPVTGYFAIRNTLIIQHLAKGYGRFTFFLACMRRIAICVKYRAADDIRMFELALKDLENDLEGIAETPSDEKFAQLKQYPLTKNPYTLVVKTFFMSLKRVWNYDTHTRRIKNFISEKLSDQKFWRQFLKIE